MAVNLSFQSPVGLISDCTMSMHRSRKQDRYSSQDKIFSAQIWPQLHPWISRSIYDPNQTFTAVNSVHSQRCNFQSMSQQQVLAHWPQNLVFSPSRHLLSSDEDQKIYEWGVLCEWDCLRGSRKYSRIQTASYDWESQVNETLYTAVLVSYWSCSSNFFVIHPLIFSPMLFKVHCRTCQAHCVTGGDWAVRVNIQETSESATDDSSKRASVIFYIANSNASLYHTLHPRHFSTTPFSSPSQDFVSMYF